jgi:hypothetical protein
MVIGVCLIKKPLEFIFFLGKDLKQSSFFLCRADLDLLIALAAKTWLMTDASAARCHKMTLSQTKRQRLSSPHNRIGLAPLYHTHSPRVLWIECGWKTWNSLIFVLQPTTSLFGAAAVNFIYLFVLLLRTPGFLLRRRNHQQPTYGYLYRFSRCRVLYCFVLSTGSRCVSRMPFTVSH